MIRAYEEQCAAIEKLGGRIVLMASRALVKAARSPDDYAKVYDRILGQVKEPVIIHWLGEMFDPALAGYWGYADHSAAMAVALDVVADNAAKVDGVKISLLDKDKEIAMRRRLAQGVRMYTGDDFNYAELIAGDDKGYSDALLGIFDVIAPAAAAALGALDARRDARPSTTSSRRPCRCRATSSRRRPASTRPAWCSWPISTACRIISPWSAARRARARPCISPNCSAWRTPPGCSPIRIVAAARMRARHGDARRGGVMRVSHWPRSVPLPPRSEAEWWGGVRGGGTEFVCKKSLPHPSPPHRSQVLAGGGSRESALNDKRGVRPNA